MSKIKIYGPGQYAFYCPGCKTKHVYTTSECAEAKLQWKFNGDLDKPSFTPSLLNRWGKHVDANWQEPKGTAPDGGWSGICHLFVTDGKIIYCSDSTHAYAGKTIEMEDIKV